MEPGNAFISVVGSREEKYCKGHTRNYMVIKYKTDENLENRIKVVKIIDANEEFMIAE